MRPDLYTRVLLTIIAICLTVLTLRAVWPVPEAKAATSTTCTGELKANAWGGIEPALGGYKIQIRCD